MNMTEELAAVARLAERVEVLEAENQRLAARIAAMGDAIETCRLVVQAPGSQSRVVVDASADEVTFRMEGPRGAIVFEVLDDARWEDPELDGQAPTIAAHVSAGMAYLELAARGGEVDRPQATLIASHGRGADGDAAGLMLHNSDAVQGMWAAKVESV